MRTLGGDWGSVPEFSDEDVGELCDIVGGEVVAALVRLFCGRRDLALPPKSAVMSACLDVLSSGRRFSRDAVEGALREELAASRCHAERLRWDAEWEPRPGSMLHDYIQPGQMALRRGDGMGVVWRAVSHR